MFVKALWYSHEDTIDMQDLAMDDLKSSTNWKRMRPLHFTISATHSSFFNIMIKRGNTCVPHSPFLIIRAVLHTQ
jgi:hypothetical protein